MGILKTLSVSHKREANGNYSILLQKTPATNQPCLIFEAGTIVCLEGDEAEAVRRNGGFVKIVDAYACLGMLQYAYEGSKEVLFLVIVTNCISVGKIQNNEIYCISDVALLSMRNATNDQQLVQSVKRLISSGCFYFSHSTLPNMMPYDLTLAAQRAHMTNETDNQFFWNRLLHRHFERFGINTNSWLVKVLCGGININTVYIGGIQAKACLISRLSCERAGTRFNVRGVNDLGHVANFVETELVIYLNTAILSYVIIRGSIPLFWEQPGVQVGSHRIVMSRGSEISQAAYDKHMFLLKERFDNVVIINLLSSKESELLLNQLFNSHHKASRIGVEFPFVNFDYHALATRSNRDNLEKLYSYELDKYCDQYGFFFVDKGQIMQLQRGVMRVNCLDCLDRTNSMQTFIGLKMLSKLIKPIDRIDVDKTVARLTDVYGNLWTANGDQISRIYTGTGALDGKNLLKDGTLSVARTIQNNLLDGSKQTAIDILILGRVLNFDYAYRAASLLPHYFMNASPNILVGLCDRYLDYCHPEPIRVAVATWNVNGGRHFDNVAHCRARPLSDWLLDYRKSVVGNNGCGRGFCETLIDTADDDDADGAIGARDPSEQQQPIDIYAIGFQEIVDLNASNIVASSGQNQREWLIQIQRTLSRDHQYLLVTSVQLVGVCLFIFIRSNMAPYIRDVCSDQVKTGLKGAAGNKGAVAIRFRYKASSLCFVCAHFAAGQSQVNERNYDYAEITRRIQFPMGRSINSHDYVFWCGDFNYRLDKLTNDEVRQAAALGEYERLLEHDQLRLSQANGLTFKNYVEAKIEFAPTYKYDTNSNEYDSSEKCRVPAYTDRVLFKKRHPTTPDEQLTDESQIKFYNRCELMSSDHRPVIAEFEIQALDVDKSLRREVLERVLEDCGPPDCTVYVQVDGHTDVTDEHIFSSILKLLADEAGEIVLVRYSGKSSLMVIFGDGKSALKALELNGLVVSEYSPDSRLIISLRTSDWQEQILHELKANLHNTTNLVTGEPPKVHLEDDEDETAQELNMSLGPEVTPDSICCLSHDIFLTADAGKQIMDVSPTASASPSPIPTVEYPSQQQLSSQRPAVNPPIKSPMQPPSRPPPPPPGISTAKRDPPPLPNPPRPTNVTSTPIRGQNEPGAFQFPSNENDAISLDQTSSVDLLEMSSCNLGSEDYDDDTLPPPPSMAAPIFQQNQPLTPATNQPPPLPPKSPAAVGLGNRPTRRPPAPPIPSRVPPPRPALDNNNDNDNGDPFDDKILRADI